MKRERSGLGTVKLSPDSTREYIRTRFVGFARDGDSDAPPMAAV